jgi:hypothetical protein
MNPQSCEAAFAPARAAGYIERKRLQPLVAFLLLPLLFFRFFLCLALAFASAFVFVLVFRLSSRTRPRR